MLVLSPPKISLKHQIYIIFFSFFQKNKNLHVDYKNKLLKVFQTICESYSFLRLKRKKLDLFTLGGIILMNQKWFSGL